MYFDLDNSIIKLLKMNWNRVFSLDIETNPPTKGDMLTNERILGIGVCRRIEKELDTNLFVLKEDNDESELELLERFDSYLKQNRPFGVVGFAFRGYDIPLFAIKRHRIGPKLWVIRDLVRRTPAIDIQESVRDYLGRLKGRSVSYRELGLNNVCRELCFKHLKFENVTLEIPENMDKGEYIYRLWKEDTDKFRKYLRGDIQSTLLLAEEIFKDVLT